MSHLLVRANRDGAPFENPAIRLLALLVAFLLTFTSGWTMMSFLTTAKADSGAIPDIEVVLAADPASNNMALTGFDTKLKTALQSSYGIPADKVHIRTVESAAVSSGFSWYRFDHTQNAGYAQNTATNYVVQYADTNGCPNLDYHIIVNGSTIDFYGYGVPAYKDFLFAPNSNANNKIFKFTMNEAMVDYHTADGAGFLFNCKYTYNGGSRTVSGYMVLIGSANATLYKLDNVDLNSYTQGSGTGSGTVTSLYTVAKPVASSGTNRYLKLVASPTNVSFYQFTDSTYSTIQTKIIDNYALPTQYNSFGFGPIMSYVSHGCSVQTHVQFSNLQMSEDTSVSFADLVKETNWDYKNSLRIFANVDSDGVPDFGTTSSLSTVLYYMLQNNAHYAGWGVNNAISIGGYNSVSAQAAGFIARNSGHGTFINRSNAATDTLDEGVAALAQYINSQLATTPAFDKPTLDTDFNGGGSVTCTAPDTTQLGNPVSNYDWQVLDVATGSWQDVPDNDDSATFTFAPGSYNYVSLSVQDSVTGEWSSPAISYIANDTNAPCVSQFEVDKTELMPDTSVDALRTGTVVAATDRSYHPAGEAVTDWEWHVYNSTLVEQAGLAKTFNTSTVPATVNFDFNGLPAGKYTIKERVKKGAGAWSSYFSQTVTVYREGATLSISRTDAVSDPVQYIDSTTIHFSVASSGGAISKYRPIFVPVGGGDTSIGDWAAGSGASLSGTATLSSGNYDVYLQALDVDGNSKTQLLGRYLQGSPTVAVSCGGAAIVKGESAPSASNGTDFGGINIAGGPVTHTFTIENTGTATLELSGVALSGDTADFVLTGPASMSVAQGASTTFTVAFDPSATGLCLAGVTVTSNDTANSPYSFAISGTGTKPQASLAGNGQPIASGDNSPGEADGTDFGRTSVTGATVEKTFTVENTGDGPLTLADVTVSGDNASDFTVTAPETLAIPAGGSEDFQVTFDPSGTGSRKATVSIASDDENTPYTFGVEGYGLNDQNYITSFSLEGLMPTVTGSIAGTDISLNVPHDTDVTALVASYETEGVSVKVGGVQQDSGVTANDFTHPVVYTVEAEDGAKRQYTVTVHILPDVDASLASINLGVTSITGLSPDKQEYNVDVPNGTNPAILTPTAVASDPNATIGAWAYDAAGKSWGVTVTAEDGVTQLTYAVNVNVLPATSTTLPGLDISTGSNVDGSQGSSNGSSGSAPGGDIKLTQTSGGYKATVEYLTGSLVFDPKVPQGSTVIVNGKVMASNNVTLPLKVGDNSVQVQIIQPDGSSASFTMKVTRKAQGRGLNDLDIIDGYLRPDLTSSQTSYEAGIPYTVTAFKVLVRASDPRAVITVNGTRVNNGRASKAYPISVRTPVDVTVVVKDSTGLIKVYHVHAVRSRYKSDNNYMNSLTVIGGRLTSGFSKYKTSYTVNVAHSVTSIKFRPGSTFIVARVRVNGALVKYGATSGAIRLNPGKNTVRITVTAENGAVRTYTITVNRAK